MLYQTSVVALLECDLGGTYLEEGAAHVGRVHAGQLVSRQGVEMNDQRTTALTTDPDIIRYAWLAPERIILGLLCFLTFICACVAGLLLASG